MENVLEHVRGLLANGNGIVSGKNIVDSLEPEHLIWLPEKHRVKAIVQESQGKWICVDDLVVELNAVKSRVQSRRELGIVQPEELVGVSSTKQAINVLKHLDLLDNQKTTKNPSPQIDTDASIELEGELLLKSGWKYFICPSHMDATSCPKHELFFVSGTGGHFRESKEAKIGDKVLFQQATIAPNPNPYATNVRLVTSSSWSQGSPVMKASPIASPSRRPRSSRPGIDEAKSGCVIFVDMSNVWLSGRQESARREGLYQADRPIDPLWRFNINRLVQTVLCGGAVESQPRPLAFASIVCSGEGPPNPRPIDDINMVHFDVSHFSGREKEVDHYIVRQMAKDIGARSAMKKYAPAHSDVKRTFCLISGDRDFLGVVEDAVEAGDCVEIWAFSSSMSKAYKALAKEIPLVRIFHLEDFMDRFGFRETTIEKNSLPPESTAVLVSMGDLRREISAFIEFALKFASTATGCTYQVHSSGRSTFVAFRDASFQDFCSIMEKLRAMADVSDGSVRAFTLQEYDTMNRERTEAALSPEGVNSYHSLSIVDDENNEPFSVAKPSKSKPKPLGEPSLSVPRCPNREFCVEGTSCRKSHSHDEYNLFLKSAGKSPYKLQKYIECTGFGCHKDTKIRSRCTYLHSIDNEPRLCRKCLRLGCGPGCATISDMRDLIDENTLRKLRTKRYIR